MADRSSQWIFAEVFTMIAKYVPKKKQPEAAEAMWKLSMEFDFSPGDMEVDDILIGWGLAKKGVDKDYPDEGEITLFKYGSKWR
jgi:hypothetical protein